MKHKTPFQRPGYSTVCPYLMVEDVAKQMEFMKYVFQGETMEDAAQNPDGHAEIRIGDTVIMMGAARPAWPSRQGMNYVYVEDLDEVFRRAQERGARVLLEPVERYYGDRECGFEDLHGNQWWCASFMQTYSQEELEARFQKSQR